MSEKIFLWLAQTTNSSDSCLPRPYCVFHKRVQVRGVRVPKLSRFLLFSNFAFFKPYLLANHC
jgi:hypothetical protein